MPTSGSRWHPFVSGTALPYERNFPSEQFARLRDGLVPREMEDKWYIHFETPHLLFHRSWTGKPYFRVQLAEDGEGGAQVTEALWDPSSTIDLDPDYQTRLLEFLIGAILLGEPKPFPLPTHIKDGKSALMFRHGIGGYRPSPPRHPPPPRRPWWRFWR